MPDAIALLNTVVVNEQGHPPCTAGRAHVRNRLGADDLVGRGENNRNGAQSSEQRDAVEAGREPLDRVPAGNAAQLEGGASPRRGGPLHTGEWLIRVLE